MIDDMPIQLQGDVKQEQFGRGDDVALVSHAVYERVCVQDTLKPAT